MSNLTLGSLFDGSGGFPLGGILAGIKPIWASEIEPFPVRVTTKRLPEVKHYGDVSKLKGSEIEPVDIVTFGSPCQDMSIAGRRAGLDGSRSNLFYEAVRVIKEMREATNGRYPRWAVWENVPGAFSSNKGEDFRCVLEQICKIKDDGFSVPECKKWLTAGKIVGDGFSVAWRVFDAQFWGVPQRRKSIYFVADLAGESAGKILFESEGMSGYSAESFRAWQRAAGGAEDRTGASGIGVDGYNGSVTDDVSSTLGENCGMSSGRNGIILNDQGGSRMDVTDDVTSTLRAKANHPPCVMDAAGFCTEHSAKARGIGYQEETAPTLREGVVPAAIALETHPNDSRLKIDNSGSIQTITGRAGTGGGNVPLVMNERQYAMTVSENVANTLTETDNKGTQCVFENHSQDTRYKGPLEVAQTVSATYGEGGNNQPFVVSEIEPKTLKIRSGCEGGGKGALIQSDKSATLGCNNDQTVFVPAAYGICSKHSNAMQSDNPNSGFYEADTSRTIDTSNQCPAKNQGGMAVVCVDQGGGKSSVNISEELSPTLAGTHGGEPAICIQGSMIGRQDKNGPQGSGINEDVSFTLDSVDRHAVYSMTSGCYQTCVKEKAPPIMARDYKDAAVVSVPAYGIGRDAFNQGKNALYNPSVEEELQPTIVAKGPGGVALPQSFYPQMKAESMCVTEDVSTTLVKGTNPGFQNGVVEPAYTVRRLTPTECARLQGFPDWWCAELETAEPTAADIAFWTEVFETHRKATAPDKKPKTEKQIIKWLKDPYSDSAEYRLWGKRHIASGSIFCTFRYCMGGRNGRRQIRMIEKVNPAHPDKVADRIAGAIVDLAYSTERDPKIAVEVLIGHGVCHVVIETTADLDTREITSAIRRIAGNVSPDIMIVPQDKHLTDNQSDGFRCGDNGIFKGMPLTSEQKALSEIAHNIYAKYPYDGKYILDETRLIICQSNADSDSLRNLYPNAEINPIGDWTGGIDVDTGATNRKLGSDMADSVTGGGLHGKDLSKADVSVNIYAFMKAQETGKPVELCCAIGDTEIDGSPYSVIVEAARRYIVAVGGFEKLAEWGLF